MWCRSRPWREALPLGHSSHYIIFLQDNSSVPKGCSHEHSLLVDKGEAIQVPNCRTKWELPVGSSFEFFLWPWDLCSTAQPGDQPSIAQAWGYSGRRCITNSSTHSGLVRISTLLKRGMPTSKYPIGAAGCSRLQPSVILCLPITKPEVPHVA